jgi:hypothetical protein
MELAVGALPGLARGVAAFDLYSLGRNMVFGFEKVNEKARTVARKDSRQHFPTRNVSFVGELRQQHSHNICDLGR